MHTNFFMFFFSNLKTVNSFEGEEGSTDPITQTNMGKTNANYIAASALKSISTGVHLKVVFDAS